MPVLNSLDPDQARHYVVPDLGPNCLQRLSVNNTSRQKLKGTCNTVYFSFFQTEENSSAVNPLVTNVYLEVKYAYDVWVSMQENLSRVF